MKNINLKGICLKLLFAIICLSAMQAQGQAPQKMSYQAVIRDNNETLVANTQVGIQVSILDGGEDGEAIFVETHSVETNTNGLATLEVGGGIALLNSFDAIQWEIGNYYIKTELDLSGGTNYTITGSAQLLSVPYSLYSANSGSSIAGPQGIQGPSGPQGPAGAAGPQGQPGPQGPQGAAGQDGTGVTILGSFNSSSNLPATGNLGDAYLIQGELYVWEGSGWQNVGSIQGPQGPQGPAGASGAQGATGPAGAQGPQGPQGQVGAQGATGATGAAGTNGKTILSGTVNPAAGAGTIGDFYLNTSANTLFGPKTAGGWGTSTSLVGPAGATGPVGPQGSQGPTGAAGPQGNTGPAGATGPAGPQGPQGQAGAQGATGATGAAGTDGKTILSGTVNPAAGTGTIGDFYLNTSANTLFGPKTAGGWGTSTSLVGPAGATGPIGPQGNTGPAGSAGVAGADGKTIVSGPTIPTTAMGTIGDFYINTTASAIYGPKTAGGWGAATSLIGPQGITGQMGPAGPQGPIGPAGNSSGPAGGALTGFYPNPYIAENAVTQAQLINGAVNTAKMEDNAITSAKIQNGAITMNKIAQSGATSGQVISWNGTAWTPATVSGVGAPTGPAGGDLSGTYPNPTIAPQAVISSKLAANSVTNTKIEDDAITESKIINGAVTANKVANLAIINSKLADNVVTESKLSNMSVTTNKIANGAVTSAKLGIPGTAVGQVLKWNGTQWLPGTDNNSLSNWTVPPGAGPNIYRNSGTVALGAGADGIGTITTGPELLLQSPGSDVMALRITKSGATNVGGKRGIQMDMASVASTNVTDAYQFYIEQVSTSGVPVQSDYFFQHNFDNTPDNYIKYMRINRANSNIIFNESKTASREFGNFILANGHMCIGATTPHTSSGITYRLTLQNSITQGRGIASGFDAYSDKRVKSQIETIKYGLNAVMRMNPVSYMHHDTEWIDGKLVIGGATLAIGILAQELYEIVPEMVNKPDDENSSLWSVDYDRFGPVLVKAVQEQQAMIDQLQKENQLLKQSLDQQKSGFEFLKAEMEALKTGFLLKAEN